MQLISARGRPLIRGARGRRRRRQVPAAGAATVAASNGLRRNRGRRLTMAVAGRSAGKEYFPIDQQPSYLCQHPLTACPPNSISCFKIYLKSLWWLHSHPIRRGSVPFFRSRKERGEFLTPRVEEHFDGKDQMLIHPSRFFYIEVYTLLHIFRVGACSKQNQYTYIRFSYQVAKRKTYIVLSNQKALCLNILFSSSPVFYGQVIARNCMVTFSYKFERKMHIRLCIFVQYKM